MLNLPKFISSNAILLAIRQSLPLPKFYSVWYLLKTSQKLIVLCNCKYMYFYISWRFCKYILVINMYTNKQSNVQHDSKCWDIWKNINARTQIIPTACWHSSITSGGKWSHLFWLVSCMTFYIYILTKHILYCKCAVDLW